MDSPYLVKGKRVLDFGCGCGASGLAALKSKAKMVMFNDIDEGTGSQKSEKVLNKHMSYVQPETEIHVIDWEHCLQKNPTK